MPKTLLEAIFNFLNKAELWHMHFPHNFMVMWPCNIKFGKIYTDFLMLTLIINKKTYLKDLMSWLLFELNMVQFSL